MNTRIVASLAALIITLPMAAFSQSLPEQSPFWISAEHNVYGTGMIWHDCNRDGYIDVFFGNGNDIVRASNTIYISNKGVLPSSASWMSTNLEYSGHCAVGDIDDNGYPDFAVANFLGSGGFSTANLSNVYMNYTGLPTHAPTWYTGDSIYSFSCAFGDVDNDGDLDLAFATGEPYGNRSLKDRVYYNVDGALQALPGWQSSVYTQAMDATWGDVDRDGDLDLAMATDDRGAIMYRNNGGSLSLTPVWQSANIESSNTLIFGDVNGDGWLDLVVAFNYQLGGQGKFMAFFNDGAGNLNTTAGWQSSSGGYGSGVSMYDVDNDGDQDLAAGRWWDRLRIYENLGDTFTSTPVWQANPETVVEEIAWVDVDGEGVELRADTFFAATGNKLYYTRYSPLYSIDSVLVDGQFLGYEGYCYDLISGWVSLADMPAESCVVYYQYSFTNDLTISNWDTSAMAFASQVEPFLDLHADVTYGQMPLTVQFSNSSVGASSWLWRFGDGDSSTVQSPLHTYDTAGAFDVYLEAILPDGWHARLKPKMIVALNDSLIFPDMNISDHSTFTMPVYLRNSQPMHGLVLPLTWAGNLNLSLVSYNTDTCRTEYFESVELVAYDGVNKRAAFNLRPSADGSLPPLPPGEGPVLNLVFSHVAGSDSAVVDTITIPPRELLLDADYAQYQPAVEAGTVKLMEGLCGDFNGDGEGPNAVDLTYFVEYLFNEGPPPPQPELADINGADGFINIIDLTWMVSFLFAEGAPPDCGF